ncbi:MAG: TetR/AcrR family transcriptional regulator [Labilithrix sp.]|nr:TetR/AcrR family transcriptional regulator [Labilithrix sp.]MBX3211339.1 TetR/AcrR family transcriptional regulator [Labilithrix sp.]
MSKAPQQRAEEGPDRPLRADAKRNRDRLLAAASRAFSERGADASLEDIARRAKVGIGTLYRHFPTRESLLVAACDDRLLTLAEESRSTVMPPTEMLRRYLEQIVRHASMYRGLAASFGMVLQSGSPGCHATTEEGRRLLEQAQRAGAIRRDVDLDDLLCVATAISIAASEGPIDGRRVTRLVGMFFDGLRTNAPTRG